MALAIMLNRTDQTIKTSLPEVEELWRENAGLFPIWWSREWRAIFHADISQCEFSLKDIQLLHRKYPFYQDLTIPEVLSELRANKVIFVGNLLEYLSERYWRPWVEVGANLKKVRFEQRYYWLEGFLGMSHAAVSSEEEIAKVRALARQFKVKLHRMRNWE